MYMPSSSRERLKSSPLFYDPFFPPRGPQKQSRFQFQKGQFNPHVPHNNVVRTWSDIVARCPASLSNFLPVCHRVSLGWKANQDGCKRPGLQSLFSRNLIWRQSTRALALAEVAILLTILVSNVRKTSNRQDFPLEAKKLLRISDLRLKSW